VAAAFALGSGLAVCVHAEAGEPTVAFSQQLLGSQLRQDFQMPREGCLEIRSHGFRVPVCPAQWLTQHLIHQVQRGQAIGVDGNIEYLR